MAGQTPSTPPPGFGAQYADRQAQQQRLEGALVATDLDRRAGMMGNIISNAPNIAALSGVGSVDQLANMFADAEAPIFNNAYGQEGDAIRRAQQKASLAATNRSNRPSKSSSVSSGLAYDPNRMGFIIPEGHKGAGEIVQFDNPEDVQKWAHIYSVGIDDLPALIVPPGHGGTHSVGTTGKGSADQPGGTVQVPATGFTPQNVTPTPDNNIVDNGDGTWTNNQTGVTVDSNGNIVE